ncbi:hypothetical protein G6F22_016433 [Rhizopus arrhizus]|nr:hypothetical protein G6F22_016433 [Rhizopus arrhizus]
MGRLAGRDVRSARYRRCRQGSRFRGAGGHSRGGGRAGHRQRAHGHQLAPAAGAGLGFPCGRRLHTAGAHHFRTTLDGTPYPACLPARGAGRSQPRPGDRDVLCFGPVQYYSDCCLLQIAAEVGGCRGDRVVQCAERPLAPPAQWIAPSTRKYLTYGFTLAGQNPRPDAAFGHRLPRPVHGLGMLAAAPRGALLDPAQRARASPLEYRHHAGTAAAGPASATC